MVTNVTNNSFIPNTDSLFQNFGDFGTQFTNSHTSSVTDPMGTPDLGITDETSSSLGKRAEWDQEFESVLAKGDGNAAVYRIKQGLDNKLISKDEAIVLAKQVQEAANAAGGGRINSEMRNALKEALGTDVDHISKGKTRPQMGWEKVWNGFLKFLGLV
jgi:hypothetical protein